MRKLVLFILLVLLSAPCFAQYELYRATSVTDPNSSWHELFYVKKDINKMKELYPKFKMYVENRWDIGALSYKQIEVLYDFTRNYSSITGTDQSIDVLNKAHKLFSGIKEYMGKESFKSVPSVSLNDYVDEVYRVLPIDFFKTVRLKNTLDMATKKLLFKDGLAEYCITRPDPGLWSNRNSVTCFKYAIQAENMLAIYKSYFEDDSNIEPSKWFQEIWADEKYMAYKKGYAEKPGRPAATWDLNGTITVLKSLSLNPTQRDIDVLLGHMGQNGRNNRGLAESVFHMVSFMRSNELKASLLEDLIKVINKFIDLNEKGIIIIYGPDKFKMNTYLNKAKELLTTYNELIANSIPPVREEYYENGKIKLYENYYGPERKLANRQFFYETGGKKRQENYNKETGLISSVIERTEKGTISKEEFYNDEGVMIKYLSYWPSGCLKERALRDENGKWSQLETFNDKGKLDQKIYDVNDNPEYTTAVEQYNQDGALVTIDYYNGSVLKKMVIKDRSFADVSVDKELYPSTEAKSFLANMDVNFAEMVEKGMALGLSDIEFIFGKDGQYDQGPAALETLASIYNDPNVSSELKEQARYYAILLIIACCGDANNMYLTREHYNSMFKISDKVGFLSITPVDLVESMRTHEIDIETQVVMMKSYSSLLPDMVRSIIKK